MKSTFLILLLFLLICSCSHVPRNVRIALKAAGENRPELEKVIQHYNQDRADSLKLKAAYFLIGNMFGFTYYNGDLIEKYYLFFDVANTRYKNDRGYSFEKYKLITDSLRDIYGPFSYDQLNVFHDLKDIKAAFLIDNIDMAFKVWNEQPWGKDISFAQFCEYILPYRIGDENPDFDRRTIYNRYNPFLDSARSVNADAALACSAVNNELRREGWCWTDGIDFLPRFGAKELLEHRVGVCREYADIALYVTRATGIPVSIDFTPQWPFRSMGHTWNTVLTRENKNIAFMGVESNPGQPHKADHKFAKIYRNTFAIQPNSLIMTAGINENIPPLFTNPRFIDVSDEYFKGSDVRVQLNSITKEDKYAYICVFNDKDWVPIHWGKIDKGSVVFTRMGRDIVYLPAFYRNGNIIPAALPFFLTKEGDVKFLNPDTTTKQSMKLTRKYPVLTILWRLQRMVGGRFQGANQSDFRDSVNLYKIDSLPEIFYQTKNVNTDKSFRYVRYKAPVNSHGNIAELEFYGANDTVHPLKGRIIGDEGLDQERSKEKAMDGNVSTFFDAYWADYAWVGLDLGTGRKVTKIRFIPVNDGNNIESGDEYELFYWDLNNGWISAGNRIATETEMIFGNVPSGALYLLSDHTKGNEERIFTYENGKQVFW
jgi:hypothetical protein